MIAAQAHPLATAALQVFIVAAVGVAAWCAWFAAKGDRDERWARDHRVPTHPTTPPRFTRDDPSPTPRNRKEQSHA